jgi:hypothetical protein
MYVSKFKSFIKKKQLLFLINFTMRMSFLIFGSIHRTVSKTQRKFFSFSAYLFLTELSIFESLWEKCFDFLIFFLIFSTLKQASSFKVKFRESSRKRPSSNSNYCFSNAEEDQFQLTSSKFYEIVLQNLLVILLKSLFFLSCFIFTCGNKIVVSLSIASNRKLCLFFKIKRGFSSFSLENLCDFL